MVAAGAAHRSDAYRAGVSGPVPPHRIRAGGLTYRLVDHSLSSGPTVQKVVTDPRSTLLRTCKEASGSGALATDPALQATCKSVFASGVQTGANQQRGRALHHLLLYSLISLAALTLVAGALGWAIGDRMLRPIRAITGAARRASDENLAERLALPGPRDELTELADTFDAMLDRLDTAFAGQRRFVANASHELRTPLTVMRTAIDVTLAKPNHTTEQLEAMASEVREAVTRAEALIDALLTLARSDRRLGPLEVVDLATAAEDALESIGSLARARGLHVEAALEPAETNGDRLLIERMVANLVDNAARHNTPSGRVALTTGLQDGRVYVTVTNSGDVIPEAALATLFEPFRRLQERVGHEQGVGLGLSIVRSVVTAHGGELRVSAPPEGGLCVTASFAGAAPRCQQPAANTAEWGPDQRGGGRWPLVVNDLLLDFLKG